MDAATGTLIVTAILAIITGYYAWQTREMVKEMEKSRQLTERTLAESEKDRQLTRQTLEEMQMGRQLSLLPVMTAQVITKVVSYPITTVASLTEAGGAIYDVTKKLHIVITNIGNAPAFDTKVRVELDNPVTSGWDIPKRAGNLYTFAANGQAREIIHPISETDITIRNDREHPRIKISFTYINLYERQFSTVLLLQTTEWTFLKHARIIENRQIPWMKLKEVSSLK